MSEVDDPRFHVYWILKLSVKLLNPAPSRCETADEDVSGCRVRRCPGLVQSETQLETSEWSVVTVTGEYRSLIFTTVSKGDTTSSVYFREGFEVNLKRKVSSDNSRINWLI